MASNKRSRRGAQPPARKTSGPPRTPRNTRYIESSALLAALLEQDAAAIRALRAPGPRLTSAITFAEANRAVVRARVTGRLTPAQERDAVQALQTFERRCHIVTASVWVLTRAGHPFPVEPVRTLDAIHLATAELLGEPPQLVTIVTRDVRVRDNAMAMGYMVE